jgi:hypothetical protein
MDEERIYTLTMEQLISMLEDAEAGSRVCRGQLEHYLLAQEDDNICALLAESFWANFNITKLLKDEMVESVVTDEGHIVIAEKALMILQSLVFSKELANQELNKYSISTKLN